MQLNGRQRYMTEMTLPATLMTSPQNAFGDKKDSKNDIQKRGLDKAIALCLDLISLAELMNEIQYKFCNFMAKFNNEF